ncbi:MAG: thioredoxin family protein [Armatimonadota bacterium]|nr:thioredoxin family protein [Armatimonadota bacterium]MDR7484095.1 thioredoxin family protein [Armatimonadota bacterium]MDR7519335.1 thioredoxin family protein [Armatimonadota bacterium]MDR7550806.1 thioredoxin family protein [Armatimonadota bacterium]
MAATVEFFSAECRLCERTLGMLTAAFPGVKIEVHRASECRDGRCCELAERYGVRAVPALVVDGRVVLVGLPGEQDIEALTSVLLRQGEHRSPADGGCGGERRG